MRNWNARLTAAFRASKSSSALVSYSSTDGDASWLCKCAMCSTAAIVYWPSSRFSCATVPLADYLACGTAATSIDLFGLNNYRWCGASTVASYATVISTFQNFPIPAYFSEFGCVTSPPRLWTEVQAIYGDSDVYNEWSGGVAFSVRISSKTFITSYA